MNVLDLIILGAAVLAAVRGLRRGLGREAIGLGAAVLLLFAGLPLAEPLGLFVTDWWPALDPAYAPWVGLVALIGLVALAGWALTMAWHWLLGVLSLRWLDALGGAAFGLAKVTAIWLVIVALLAWLPLDGVQRALAGSLAAGALLQVLPAVRRQVEKVLPPGRPWP
ncbi:MAG TPA: CvpA family protein, partial [Firmicutes bacterium]|nr:CvpA family protein [Bacillota bacterium]